MPPGRRPKALTDNQLARYRAGQVSVTDLAAETGWGNGAVRRALLRQDVTLRRERVGRPLAHVLTDDQLDRYRRGEVSAKALAREAGWPLQTVCAALRRQGVAVRPRGRRPPRRGRAEVAEMRRLRAEGWTLARVGQRFGLTRERVRQLLAKAAPAGD